eukprot:m.193973 g.193973  ORF g.193973 m.193973 type:complete len:441 (-) comp19087_c0_seq1:164-1486(-)
MARCGMPVRPAWTWSPWWTTACLAAALCVVSAAPMPEAGVDTSTVDALTTTPVTAQPMNHRDEEEHEQQGGVYFVHMRKCGGSTIGKYLRSVLKANSQCCTDDPKSCRAQPHWGRSIPGPEWACPNFHFQEEEYACISPQAFHHPDGVTVTTLRHPVDRIISLFYYDSKIYGNWAIAHSGCPPPETSRSTISTCNHKFRASKEAKELASRNVTLWREYLNEAVVHPFSPQSFGPHANYFYRRLQVERCCDPRTPRKCEFPPTETEEQWVVQHAGEPYANWTRRMFSMKCNACSGDLDPTSKSASEMARWAFDTLQKFNVVLISDWLSDWRSKALLDSALAQLPALDIVVGGPDDTFQAKNVQTLSTLKTLASEQHVSDITAAVEMKRAKDAPAEIVSELIEQNKADIMLYTAARMLVRTRMEKIEAQVTASRAVEQVGTR